MSEEPRIGDESSEGTAAEGLVVRVTGTVVFRITDLAFLQAGALVNLVMNPEVADEQVTAVSELVLREPVHAIEHAFHLGQLAVDVEGVEVLYTEQFTEVITGANAAVGLVAPGESAGGIVW